MTDVCSLIWLALIGLFQSQVSLESELLKLGIDVGQTTVANPECPSPEGEQIHAAQDVVDRVGVRSPVRGIIVKKNFHTPGGVVSPGAVILELLQIGEERLIQAHVNSKGISHVSVGQEALVRLSALNQRITPMVGRALSTCQRPPWQSKRR